MESSPRRRSHGVVWTGWAGRPARGAPATAAERATRGSATLSDAEILSRAARLAARGAPFALATVVRREAPSSARPGWRALIEADGTLHGWLGGSCIEPTVRREALGVLRDRRPRYLVFSPEGAGAVRGRGPARAPGAARAAAAAHAPGAEAGRVGSETRGASEAPGASEDRAETDSRAEADGRASRDVEPASRAADVLVFPMICHSGGTVEIFVDPQLPSPALVLFGDSPVTRALAAMAPAAGYGVVVVGAGEAAHAYAGLGAGVQTVDSADAVESIQPGAGREAYAVVATMGEWDEDAIRQALGTAAGYVGLVASPRRAAAIRRLLSGESHSEPDLERIVSPAGLDLGAEEPGEIAVTILAELVERRRRGPVASSRTEGRGGTRMGPMLVPEHDEEPAEAEAGVATDPVCGMAVDVDRARHVHTHEGQTYYFCCPHCRERFVAEPSSFIS